MLRPEEAVAMAVKHKLAGVAFTYNDPVVWIEYVHDVCVAFKEAGLYTAFITAAYLSEAALDYVAPVVDAFKFDLKAATPEGWARLTKVKDPAPAHDATVRAKEVHGCHVEVVSNIVPGFNDDEGSLLGMAQWVRDRLGAGRPGTSPVLSPRLSFRTYRPRRSRRSNGPCVLANQPACASFMWGTYRTTSDGTQCARDADERSSVVLGLRSIVPDLDEVYVLPAVRI